LTDKDDRHKSLIEIFLANLNDTSGWHEEREYRHGYPKATDAEIKMLVAAEKKAGHPPHDLEHARRILTDAVAKAKPMPPQKTERQQWRERVQSTMAKLASMTFADWDDRPAVMLDRKAFAVLRPGAAWVEVDACDVRHTAGVMSRLAWRQRFARFGRLDLSEIPGSPLRPPTAQDFDDAALAIQAAHLEHMAREAAKAGLRELPKRATSPAAALAIARTMKIIAGTDLMGDPDMMRDAIDLERRALEAIKLGLSVLPGRKPAGMDFVNWDNRPAVLDGNKAFAVLRPGGPWVSVDRDDVWATAGVMSEAAWRKRFVGWRLMI